MKDIERIRAIGKQGGCGLLDLHVLLPNLPFLKGSEFIFKIGHATAAEFIDDDVEDLIRGLHWIEEKYKEYSDSDFGFGSPSPTAKVIQALRSRNQALALQLTDWVRDNGGNYYIEPKFSS